MTKTILLIDDEPRNLKWIGRILEGAGYEVVTAETVADADEIAMRMEKQGVMFALVSDNDLDHGNKGVDFIREELEQDEPGELEKENNELTEANDSLWAENQKLLRWIDALEQAATKNGFKDEAAKIWEQEYCTNFQAGDAPVSVPTPDPGPTSRDVVELAMEIARDIHRYVGDDCEVIGHRAASAARAICDGIRQGMTEEKGDNSK